MAGYGIVVLSFGAAIGPFGPFRWGALKKKKKKLHLDKEKYANFILQFLRRKKI